MNGNGTDLHTARAPTDQPVVLFGGFLTNPLLMRGMRIAMAKVTGQPVFLVPARSYDWMLSVSRAGWARLLRYLDRTVQQALPTSPTSTKPMVSAWASTHRDRRIAVTITTPPTVFLVRMLSLPTRCDHESAEQARRPRGPSPHSTGSSPSIPLGGGLGKGGLSSVSRVSAFGER